MTQAKEKVENSAKERKVDDARDLASASTRGTTKPKRLKSRTRIGVTSSRTT